MSNILAFILLGLAAGILSGILGIGGGIVVVPALVFLFGMSQHEAQGTTLAMLVPPIGLLAVWAYYRQGFVNIPVAAWICVGFFFGGLLGGKIATAIPDVILSKIFGVGLLLISLKMILSR